MVQFNKERLATLCEEQKVERLRVFGSAARGEERPDSDIDVLVDFSVPVGFFELIELEEPLAAFFGRPVDLLTERGLSAYFRDSILSRTEVLFDAAHSASPRGPTPGTLRSVAAVEKKGRLRVTAYRPSRQPARR